MSLLPAIGPQVPRRSYGIGHAIGQSWLALAGWRIEGDLPDVPRVVVAVAPHSSNWDFVHALAAVFALRLRVAFIGKHTLFAGLLGRFMHWVGGLPVNRGRPEGIADEVAHALRAADAMWLGVAPEGTRAAGAAFKSGFYRIALAAQVPILPVFIDYRRKVIGILPPLLPREPVDEGVAVVRTLLLGHGCRREAARTAGG
jgi:1-acyl-sn-glycerol-3-phosphate acyltransferase